MINVRRGTMKGLRHMCVVIYGILLHELVSQAGLKGRDSRPRQTDLAVIKDMYPHNQ